MGTSPTETLQSVLALSERHPWIFTLQYPPCREFFKQMYKTAVPPQIPDTIDRLLIYVHIPFCKQRCLYCNFAVDTRQDRYLQERYAAGLVSVITSIRTQLSPVCHIGGIDIGGGTPTRLESDLLLRVIEALYPLSGGCEGRGCISLESSPEDTVDAPEFFFALYEHGVSRISLGIQSTSKRVLSRVGRLSDAGTLAKAVSNLRKAGFWRVNADLIFCLPGQTLTDWQQDVDIVTQLGFDSITTYDCLYRGGGRRLQSAGFAPPSAEQYGRFYDYAFEQLTTAGFHASYGSVNFSKWPHETGTSPYFQGRLLDGLPYIGIGNYSSSMIGDFWWFAPHSVDDWINSIESGQILPSAYTYRLPLRERMAKYILLTLNFGFIDCERFSRLFGIAIERIFGEAILIALSRKWLVEDRSTLRVGYGAFRRMPQIRALFYSEEAVKWIQGNVYGHDPTGIPADRLS